MPAEHPALAKGATSGLPEAQLDPETEGRAQGCTRGTPQDTDKELDKELVTSWGLLVWLHSLEHPKLYVTRGHSLKKGPSSFGFSPRLFPKWTPKPDG